MAIGTLSSIGKKEEAGSKLYLIQFRGNATPVVSFYSTEQLTNYNDLYNYLHSRYSDVTKVLGGLSGGSISTSTNETKCEFLSGVYATDYNDILVLCYSYDGNKFVSVQHSIMHDSFIEIRCVEV